MPQTVLDLTDLTVAFVGRDGAVEAVRGVSMSVERGQCLGVVGESGSGKTQTFMAVMGLLSANGRAEYRPFGMAESNMSLKTAQNPRGGPSLDYIVQANQVEGQSPLVDNSMAQRNRRIEIILTYKIIPTSVRRNESE